MLSQKETLEAIVDFEENHHIENFKVGGLNIWPLLRLNAGAHLSSIRSTVMKFGVSSSASAFKKISFRLEKYRHLRRIGRADREHNMKTLKPECEALFLAHSGTRYGTSNGQYYDIIIDPVIDLLEETKVNWLVWERFAIWLDRVPRYRASAIFEPKLELELFKRNRKKNFAVSNDFKKNLKDYNDWQRSLGGAPLEQSYVMKMVNNVTAMSVIFEKWFKKIKPKALFVVCWYTPNITLAAILAANRLKIKTIDVQHGLQSGVHYAYSHWTNGPDEGYGLLPKFFWVWGESEAELLRKSDSNIIQPENIVVGGNVWLAGWREEYPGIMTPFREAVDNAKNLRGGSRKVILVTLQDDAPVSNLIPIIEHSPREWRWWLRLRYNMFDLKASIEAELARIGCGSYEMERSSTLPLYALMQKADVHVTWWSTCAVEALAFGLPSVIIHQNGRDAFEEYIESGDMSFAADWENAVSALRTAKRGGLSQSSIRRFAPISEARACLKRLLTDSSE